MLDAGRIENSEGPQADVARGGMPGVMCLVRLVHYRALTFSRDSKTRASATENPGQL